MPQSIKRLEIGFSPEAAVSGPILLQSDLSTTLIFNAIRKENQKYVPAGHGIVTFRRCTITKFGYPNDEAWCAIPRTRGLSYDAYEIFDSDWDRELDLLNRFAFPDYERSRRRHFLWLFHDSSFECLADDFSALLSEEPIAEILAEVSRALAHE